MKALQLKTLVLVASAIAVVAPSTSLAGFITGSTLHVSGGGVVAPNSITFTCDTSITPTCPANYGNLTVNSATGSFAQYAIQPGNTGFIHNIDNTNEPLNQPFLLPNFIEFSANNNITIDLTFIPIGNDPYSASLCLDQTVHCTPVGIAPVTAGNPLGASAFNLDKNSIGTVASFGFVGVAHNSLDNSSANIAGTFSTTFTGKDPNGALLAALTGAQQSYQSDLLLTVVGTPEPATFMLAGLGLVALGVIRAKKAA